MGWSIYITDKNGETVRLKSPHKISGSDFAVGGTQDLWMTLTFNYSRYYYQIWPCGGLCFLHGLSVKNAMRTLLEGMLLLKGEQCGDYWHASEGNARAGLLSILSLCALSPSLDYSVRIF